MTLLTRPGTKKTAWKTPAFPSVPWASVRVTVRVTMPTSIADRKVNVIAKKNDAVNRGLDSVCMQPVTLIKRVPPTATNR